MNKRTILIQILIVLVGAILFLPGLGNVRLFDWDEINFAESAREMLLTGDWLNVQINFESFWEKPPLFIWAQALSMKIFGVNEMAARLPNALIGIITLLVLFNIGRKTKDEKFGLLWTMMYVSSLFPCFYFKTGIIDPWFNLFIFLALYFFSLYCETPKTSRAALSAAFIGLAILTKGPVAFLIFGLTFFAYLCVKKFQFSFKWKDVIVYLIVLSIVGGAWFILQILNGHFSIIQDFIEYQIRLFETKDAGHGGFLLYHPVVLFFGVFPSSILAIPSFRHKIVKNEKGFFSWMVLSFWVVLILFTIVKTKIIHYSSFCWFPLTFLAAYSLYNMMEGKFEFKKWMRVVLIVLASGFGILVTGITLFDKFKESLYPYIADPYAITSMRATATWSGYEPIIGIVLIVCTILFCIRFNKKKSFGNLSILVTGCAFFIFTTIFSVVGQVEKYSQAPALDFYESKIGEDCYILPQEKSYAHYFYSRRQSENKCDDAEYLYRGDIDKVCYFVVKNDKAKIETFLNESVDAQLLYEKNGFVFYARYPKNN